jgi:hypothetical protein
MKGLYFFLGCHHSIILTALVDTAFATWSENRAPVTSLKASPTNIEARYTPHCSTFMSVADARAEGAHRGPGTQRHASKRALRRPQSTDIFPNDGTTH